MKITARISFVLLLVAGVSACAGGEITGPGRAPGNALHEGLGYFGGGGRSSVSTHTEAVARP
jgi:hypothetical protein